MLGQCKALPNILDDDTLPMMTELQINEFRNILDDERKRTAAIKIKSDQALQTTELQQVIQSEKVSVPEHTKTTTSLSELAGFYEKQGKYAQAEPLYQRALAIDEKVSGPEHPYTATSLNNLALLYYSQGNYTTALEFIRRAVHIQRSRILTDHQTDSNTAEQTGRQNKYYFYSHIKIAAAYLATNPQADLSAETLESSQLHHDGSVGNAIAQMAVRFASGNAQLVNLVRIKQDTTLAWKKTDEALITAIGAMPDKQNPELIKNLRIRTKKLTDQLTALNERLAKEFPDYNAI